MKNLRNLLGICFICIVLVACGRRLSTSKPSPPAGETQAAPVATASAASQATRRVTLTGAAATATALATLQPQSTHPPTSTIEATPASLALEGPIVSYNGIRFDVDPVLGGTVYVHTESIGEVNFTRFTFAPDGWCRQVGCVEVYPVGQYEEAFPDWPLPPLGAATILRAQDQALSFQNGDGTRSIRMRGQDGFFANNEAIVYDFQGFSDDGQYYVSIIIPIDAPILLSSADPNENINATAIPVPAKLPGDHEQLSNIIREYNQEAERQLDLLAAADFAPSLSVLDALVASLRIESPPEEPSLSTPTTGGSGVLEVDIDYTGDWYRRTFGYTRRAKNIKHFVLVMPEREATKATPGEIFSSIRFPSNPNVLLMRKDRKEYSWALEYLYEAPEGYFSGQFEAGTYYVAAAFIAAPLSKDDAGHSDDVILYAGITGGGASTDYFEIAIEEGRNHPLEINLTDGDGWACPWLYVYNGRNFERRTEILRNVRGKENERTEVSDIGPVNIIDDTITFRITEEKEETSFIDEFYIVLHGQRFHPEMGAHYADKVAEKDQNYLTINYGESYEFSFRLPRSFTGREEGNVSVVASGFYVPLAPQIGGKSRIGSR